MAANIPKTQPKAKADPLDSITRFRGPAHLCFIPALPDAEDETRNEDLNQADCHIHNRDSHRGPAWHSISGHLLNLPPSQPVTVRLLPCEVDIGRYPRPKQHKCCAPVECYDLEFSETLRNETPPTEKTASFTLPDATIVRRGTVGNVLREVGGGDAARLSTELLVGEKYDASDGPPSFTARDERKGQQAPFETSKVDAARREGGPDTDVTHASNTRRSQQEQADPPSATVTTKPFFSFTPSLVKTGSAAANHVRRFFPQFEAMMAEEGVDHGWVVCLGEAVLVASSTQTCQGR